MYTKACRTFFLSFLFYTKLFCIATEALVFDAPTQGSQIIGALRWIQSLPGDDFNTISHRHNIGYYELLEANPGLDALNIKPNTIIVLPTRYILPSVKQKGIVINLAELRLYYFHKNKIYTYPIGIGRETWDTPLGYSHIIQKLINPTWHVPRSIKDASLKEGVLLPATVPPGEDNPLGPYALRLHYHNYLIHGTNELYGVGRRSTAGCIRMFPENAKELFELVTVGTVINIVDQPYKVGWDQEKNLYLEAHLPLKMTDPNAPSTKTLVEKIVKKAIASRKMVISWSSVQTIINENLGIPFKI